MWRIITSGAGHKVSQFFEGTLFILGCRTSAHETSTRYVLAKSIPLAWGKSFDLACHDTPSRLMAGHRAPLDRRYKGRPALPGHKQQRLSFGGSITIIFPKNVLGIFQTFIPISAQFHDLASGGVAGVVPSFFHWYCHSKGPSPL